MVDYKALRKDVEAFLKKHKIEIVIKHESLFMRILGVLLFFNRSFMTGYVTTIGDKIYMPLSVFNSDEAFCRIIPHEVTHVGDFAEKGLLFVALEYLFPQWLAFFALFSLFATMNPWHLLWLLCLVALGPWPSPTRKKFEMRGFAMSMATSYWLCEEDYIKNDAKNFVGTRVDQFTGWYYYRMWPWEDKVEAELREWFGRIKTKELDRRIWFASELRRIYEKEQANVAR